MTEPALFDWQLSDEENAARYAHFHYDVDRYWGGFSRDPVDPAAYRLPDWAIGPFVRHPGNPVLAPSPDGWDVGRYSGGVHNGAIIRRNGLSHYIYRGEMPCAPMGASSWYGGGIDYICDIGLAVSEDGVAFTKDVEHSPLFRMGDDARFSFEDVSIAEWDGAYYLFCNRWDWLDPENPGHNGTYLAVSTDLVHWEKVGLVFPKAESIHRNGVVLQTPDNRAARVGGQFVMYLNWHLIATSDDMLHWTSHAIAPENHWPGGEGCFALCDHDATDPDAVLLFTGGHHTGHFYAIGEVRLSKHDLERPLDWLPRPVLAADPAIPWEDGRSAVPPHGPVSGFRDTIFFNGLTRHEGRWWVYYGGSEYYTCLAHAPALGGPGAK